MQIYHSNYYVELAFFSLNKQQIKIFLILFFLIINKCSKNFDTQPYLELCFETTLVLYKVCIGLICFSIVSIVVIVIVTAHLYSVPPFPQRLCWPKFDRFHTQTRFLNFEFPPYDSGDKVHLSANKWARFQIFRFPWITWKYKNFAIGQVVNHNFCSSKNHLFSIFSELNSFPYIERHDTGILCSGMNER